MFSVNVGRCYGSTIRVPWLRHVVSLQREAPRQESEVQKCDKVFSACISPTSTDVPDALPALDDLTSDNFVDNVMGESLPPVENAIPQSSLKMSPPSAGASRGTSLLRKMGSTKLTKMESSALYYGSGMFVVGVLLLFGIRLGSRGRRIRDRLSGGGHSPADPTFQLIGLLMAVVSVGVIGFALRPMAPEFAESLVDTPEDQRKGKVFEPLAKDGKSVVTGLEGASAVIAEIGKSAGVVVSQRGGKKKFASAHDLRRSFGARCPVGGASHACRSSTADATQPTSRRPCDTTWGKTPRRWPMRYGRRSRRDLARNCQHFRQQLAKKRSWPPRI